MDHQFQSRHPEFAGFSDFYASRLRPELIARDGARAKAVREGWTLGLVLGGLVLAVGVGVGLAQGDHGWTFGSVFLAGMVGMGSWFAKTRKIADETKSRLVNGVLGYVGWQFDAHVGSYDVAPFTALFLLPAKVDRMMFEDAVTGQAHGAAFRSVEATLQRERTDSQGNRTYKTLFQGQLMQMDFPTRTFGRTVVLRDKGMFNAKRHGDMKRVGLASPRFERLFEAYSTDQVEGRVILDPVFMQAMLDLEASVSGKNIRFGFQGDTLFIAVETGDQYEAGSMLKSLDDPAPTQKIIDEVGLLFDIADKLSARSRG